MFVIFKASWTWYPNFPPRCFTFLIDNVLQLSYFNFNLICIAIRLMDINVYVIHTSIECWRNVSVKLFACSVCSCHIRVLLIFYCALCQLNTGSLWIYYLVSYDYKTSIKELTAHVRTVSGTGDIFMELSRSGCLVPIFERRVPYKMSPALKALSRQCEDSAL